MELPLAFQKIAVALGLGLLVGLQRERVQSQLAGIRTFALITVLGAVSALLAADFGGWLIATGGLAVAALLAVGNLTQPHSKEVDPGLTTEVAALVMYAVGAYVVIGHVEVAIALGGGVALLLHFKAPMHAFVAKIGETDIKAIMQFVLIALVILPILPDQEYGPYQTLNPRNVWMMVVLIVAINLGGYVAYKLLGERVGTILAGILGGLVSSTATTVSYARQAATAPASARLAALVMVIASAVSSGRVLAEIAVVAPNSLGSLTPPLVAMFGWMTAVAAGMWIVSRGESTEHAPHANPAELTPAVIFGGLYAVVVLAIAAAKDSLGEFGMYWVAGLSGLHDMDAITLSTARYVEQGRMNATLGWRLILTATMANLVAKCCIAALLGHRRLIAWLSLGYVAALGGGLAILLLWPSSDEAESASASPVVVTQAAVP